jgi:hypothetical protein
MRRYVLLDSHTRNVPFVLPHQTLVLTTGKGSSLRAENVEVTSSGSLVSTNHDWRFSLARGVVEGIASRRLSKKTYL